MNYEGLILTKYKQRFQQINKVSAWHNFEMWLQSLNLDNSYKLILAFDQYEELHRLLQANPKQGARLLAAMRSFSQQQNHIVFLFVGAALFTELDKPPTDKKQLNRLREHGFIVQDTNGLWQLRVPLFEQWLRAFDRVDLD